MQLNCSKILINIKRIYIDKKYFDRKYRLGSTRLAKICLFSISKICLFRICFLEVEMGWRGQKLTFLWGIFVHVIGTLLLGVVVWLSPSQ